MTDYFARLPDFHAKMDAVDPAVCEWWPAEGSGDQPRVPDPNIRAVVLANHGTIGVGRTLMAALYLPEIIEETAHIADVRETLMAAHGKTKPTSPNTARRQMRAAG